MIERAKHILLRSWTVRVAVIVGFLQAIVAENYQVFLGVAGAFSGTTRMFAYLAIGFITYALPIILTRVFHITPERPDGLKRQR